MKHSVAVIGLRIIHGGFTLYFLLCLLYVYYAAWVSRLDLAAIVAVASLCLEGIAVFLLNNGDCPLVHIQRKLKDDTPFFALFLPAPIAKRALPTFAVLTILGLVALWLRIAT